MGKDCKRVREGRSVSAWEDMDEKENALLNSPQEPPIRQITDNRERKDGLAPRDERQPEERRPAQDLRVVQEPIRQKPKTHQQNHAYALEQSIK